jgi:tetratricopeptide (TPR) repeat protein
VAELARWTWYWQEMYEGRYRDAIDLLESFTDDWIRIKIAARPNSLYAAQAYELMDEAEKARLSYETALEQLEAEVLASPDDPRMHSSLGIVYAALGRREDATREGIRATELLTRSMDGVYYIPYVIDLAHIYTILGDNEAALEQLELMLSNPSWISEPFLRMDPRWDPLRDDPDFQGLLEKYRIEQ